MIISNITAKQGQVSSGVSARVVQVPVKMAGSDKKTDLPKEGMTAANEVKSDVSFGSDSQQVKAELNGLAKNIRSQGETLIKINDFVEGMKEKLNKIVKNYPPFPPDSPERMELLKSFTALRKEIERMTFPAEDKNYPELPLVTQSSTDSEVAAAMTDLDGVAEEVNKRQEYLDLAIREIASSLHADKEEDVLIKSGEVRDELLTEAAGMTGEERVNVFGQLLD